MYTLLLSLSAQIACQSVHCGQGTHEIDGLCVADTSEQDDCDCSSGGGCDSGGDDTSGGGDSGGGDSGDTSGDDTASSDFDPFAGPFVVLYGGYSMDGPEDWDLLPGVFNIVHHSLSGTEPDEGDQILDQASTRGLHVLASFGQSGIYNADTGLIDVSAIQAVHDRWGEDDALFGYMVEAAYKLPPDIQAQVQAQVKAIDSERPFWLEFSSTSESTWTTGFNPDACDAVLSYNYPFEADDESDYPDQPDQSERRIGYSIDAINSVTDAVVVVPLIQAFGGGGYRFPPEGAQASQLSTWETGLSAPVGGVGFYRWRTSASYVGLLSDGSPDYMWSEVQALGAQVLAR